MQGPPPADEGESREDRGEGEVSLITVLNVLLRHRRALVLAPIVVGVLMVVITLVQPVAYTSTASFLPEEGGTQGTRLSGIASQFGVSVPSAAPGETPLFYADLVQSRRLLLSTVRTEYRVEEPDDTDTDGDTLEGDLVALFDVGGEGRSGREARAIEALRQRLDVSTNVDVGVVEVSVMTPWRGLSQQVLQRIIDLVNEFNLERRQTQAKEKRRFLEERLSEAREELQTAEENLERFLQNNRRYENSPQLRFEHERLQRRVRLKEQVFTSLAQSYEQARVDQVRTTPVITVINQPHRPVRADPRRLKLRGLFGIVLGGILAVLWAFGREILLTSRRRSPDDYEEFDRLKDSTLDDLRRLATRIRALLPR